MKSLQKNFPIILLLEFANRIFEQFPDTAETRGIYRHHILGLKDC
mgnify:CR=1 FL=1